MAISAVAAVVSYGVSELVLASATAEIFAFAIGVDIATIATVTGAVGGCCVKS
jgi:hypothetical protein